MIKNPGCRDEFESRDQIQPGRGEGLFPRGRVRLGPREIPRPDQSGRSPRDSRFPRCNPFWRMPRKNDPNSHHFCQKYRKSLFKFADKNSFFEIPEIFEIFPKKTFKGSYSKSQTNSHSFGPYQR